MSSTYHTTEGIVIKKTPYGEADFWVRVLTKDFGKIDLRARGVRKYNSKLKSHLDFLDHSNISFVKNEDRVPTIIDAEKISSNNNNFLNTEKLRDTLNVMRVIDEIIPLEVKDFKLFSLARDFLTSDIDNYSALFMQNVIFHEGYGMVSSLPTSTQDFIIKKWPVLKN